MMCLTFIFTVAWSVEVGIIVSVAVSLLLIVRRSSMTHIKILVGFSIFILVFPDNELTPLLSLHRVVYQELTGGNRWMTILWVERRSLVFLLFGFAMI